nr:WD repeat-containing protein [Colletotrichum truncatum]KAF6781845.1 WD repeat-containing protein [Colletotrichum truncatum]
MYCTIYAVMQNNEVKASIANFWFRSSLVVSSSATTASVFVYGWSWQASAALSFISAFSQLIPAGQLAASLGSDDLKKKLRKRATLNLEEGHTD